MTSYTCVTFGADKQLATEWWNYQERDFRSKKQAEKFGMNQMPTAGTFGFIVIEEGEDYWEIVDDFSIYPPNVSIGCNRLGVFTVQPAPKLSLV